MIYLYVKTHKKTGLKYFGYTKSANPYRYKGSGLYWRNHCKRHGTSFKTKIIAKFNDDQKEEARLFAQSFSYKNDIVQSNDWANLKIEQLDGGWDHINNKNKHLFTEKAKTTIANWSEEERLANNAKKALRGERNGMFGVHRYGKEAPGYGKPASEEKRRRISQAKKAKNIKYTDKQKQEIKNCLLAWWSDNPAVRKQRSEEYKKRGHKPPSPKGLKWWRNGDVVVRSKESPGDGWINSR